jgi:hypothetical protein
MDSFTSVMKKDVDENSGAKVQVDTFIYVLLWV